MMYQHCRDIVELLYLLQYTRGVTIKHKKGKDNIIVDALSKILGLETLKELYATDLDFKDAYENCREWRTWQKNYDT
jgi:hypothetical protein